MSHTDTGSTVITYGETTITVEGVTLTEQQIRTMQE